MASNGVERGHGLEWGTTIIVAVEQIAIGHGTRASFVYGDFGIHLRGSAGACQNLFGAGGSPTVPQVLYDLFISTQRATGQVDRTIGSRLGVIETEYAGSRNGLRRRARIAASHDFRGLLERP